MVMLRHISAVRMIWKKDLLLLAVKYVDRKTADLAYKRILNQHLIKEDDLQSRFKTVVLTRQGRIYLNDHGYSSDLTINEVRPFGTANPLHIHRELTKVKALTLFRSAGVAALPEEKPVLGQLMNSFVPMFKVEESGQEYAQLSHDEIQRELEGTGFYYRAEEFRYFLNAQGTAMSDSIRGARFIGIYLRRNECFIVYAANPGKNRMLKISEPLEQRLVDLLGKYLTASLMFNVFRNVSGESHRLNAIVISDGNALVYEMVMGSKHGHIRGKQAALKELEADRRNPGKRKHNIFRYDQELYGRVYIVPSNSNGSDSLYYLATHDTEEWISSGAQLCTEFNSLIATTVPGISGQAVCSKTGLPLVYAPIYEIGSLYKASMSDHSGRPVNGFIAPLWMHKTIRHCVRQDIPIYDSGTGMLDEEQPVYGRDGYLEGEHRGTYSQFNVRRKRTSISCAKETYEKISAAARRNNESFTRFVITAAIERVRRQENESGAIKETDSAK